MRAATENWLLQHWYGPQPPPWYLRLLEPVYGAVFEIIRQRGETKAAGTISGLPLIVVGNITAGGSGKTPLVIRLSQLAADMNIKTGIASTGYGRQGTDTRLVHANSDTRTSGDEPVLLAKRTGLPVVVAKRRADAIGKLAEMGLELIISDDGLQQADLPRDMELCVVDGMRGLGNGHLLPAGPLREPAVRLGQVDYVVTTGVWNEKPAGLETYVMRLDAGNVCSLDGESVVPVAQFRQKNSRMPVHAIAAIGNPGRFFRTLNELGVESVPHVLPDHHIFSAGDFDSITDGQTIIMTEKDAVKCRTLGLANAWYLPVDTHLPAAFENVFKDHLVRLMEKRR